MYGPAEDDESTGLLRYLEQQLDALRASAFGLTEEQSRETPCRSTLSIAGLLTHATYGMRGAVSRLAGASLAPNAGNIAAFMASFAPAADQSTTSVLAEFDAARVEYLAAIRAADPDSAAVEPPGSLAWTLRATRDPAALLPRPPGRGDGPPCRPCGHHQGAARRSVDPRTRAHSRGRASQRLLPAVRACAANDRRALTVAPAGAQRPMSLNAAKAKAAGSASPKTNSLVSSSVLIT